VLLNECDSFQLRYFREPGGQLWRRGGGRHSEQLPAGGKFGRVGRRRGARERADQLLSVRK
jgi:hypothetical protein